MDKAALVFLCVFLGGYMLHPFLWDVDLGMDLLCRSERVCLTLVDTANQFSEVVLPVCTPTSNL